MRKIILPNSEIVRNARVKQLMNNKVEKKKMQPQKLTQEQMFEVKAFMKDGLTRNEAVELVLKKEKLLNQKPAEKQFINNWNTGGFIDDNKYKQPVKHKLF